MHRCFQFNIAELGSEGVRSMIDRVMSEMTPQSTSAVTDKDEHTGHDDDHYDVDDDDVLEQEQHDSADDPDEDYVPPRKTHKSTIQTPKAKPWSKKKRKHTDVSVE